MPSAALPGRRDRSSRAARSRVRRPSATAPKGVPVTAELKRIFQFGFDCFEDNDGQTLAAAYWHAMRFGFLEKVEELFAKFGNSPPYEECAKLGLPKQEQFRYHWSRERKRMEVLEKRLGQRLFALKKRAIKGDSTGEATGPGDIYQIDATVLNVYTRSRRNRRKLVWRATLYLVVDVWSRMIVGFALSLDPPSWLGAMTALANAMTDKVAFCKEWGVTITEADWPCRHLPGSVVGDQAELARAGVLGLIKRHGVGVANPPAYRADWKGIVERRFGMVDATMKPFMPGFVHTDFRERGTEDYRLATAMTLDELHRQVIRCIRYYNDFHPLASYPRLPAMNEDEIPSVPRHLWNWGIAKCSGIPRQPDEESVRFSLLEQAEATVWRDGIHHHGCVYMCERAERERWRETARDKGRFSWPISFDRRTTDFIYVHDPESPKGFQVAKLVSERRAGTSHWEMEDELRDESDIQARQEVVAAVGRIDHDGGAAAEAGRGCGGDGVHAGRAVEGGRGLRHPRQHGRRARARPARAGRRLPRPHDRRPRSVAPQSLVGVAGVGEAPRGTRKRRSRAPERARSFQQEEVTCSM